MAGKKNSVTDVIRATLEEAARKAVEVDIVEDETETVTDDEDTTEIEDEVLEEDIYNILDNLGIEDGEVDLEEVLETYADQLDEVSKGLLGRYAEKAAKYNDKRYRTRGLSGKILKRYDSQYLAAAKRQGTAKVNATEETLSASSLHPGAKSITDPKALTASKISMMQSMMGQMNTMNKGDLTDWFSKTMAQFGKWGDGAPNASAQNQSSIDAKASNAGVSKGPKTKDAMPKLNVREDVEEMFASEDLTEEFKDKVTTLFEAAVGARVIVEQARLEEEFETALQEQVGEALSEISSKLDTYLDYVVENWLKDNEVAIESTLRNQIMEEFVDGLKGLFVEHYIEVPEDKVDILEELAQKVALLEGRLDEVLTENTELQEVNAKSQLGEILEEVSVGLVMTQKEKLAALAEGIEFDGDLDVYRNKLEIVKESYFSEKKTSPTNITEETFEETPEVHSAYPGMDRYVQAISRTVKKQ
jgi:hypothetical protein